jgi:hypothetical protein
MSKRVVVTSDLDRSGGSATVVPLRQLLDSIRPDLRPSIEDISAWPLLLAQEPTDALQRSRESDPSGRLRPIVERELRRVLGGLPQTSDPIAVQAALTSSFKLEDFEGHTSFTWIPHSYMGLLRTGPGVTGAQASLAAFGRTALDASLPLIDSLTSLVTDVDPQELEAARSILRSAWMEFVDELAVEGGPRTARADQLSGQLTDFYVPNFGVLLGVYEQGSNGRAVRQKGGDFAISRSRVVTPDEERTLTDFLVVSDYISNTAGAWGRFRDRFYVPTNQGDRDLGTRLVRVERALAVVGESVDELYAALDSVWVGPDERLTIVFDTRPTGQLAIEELLSWVQTFATVEGPQLIEHAGTRGLEVIARTIDQTLIPAVGDFLTFLARARGRAGSALHHPRVRNAGAELESALRITRDAVGDAPSGLNDRVFSGRVM